MQTAQGKEQPSTCIFKNDHLTKPLWNIWMTLELRPVIVLSFIIFIMIIIISSSLSHSLVVCFIFLPGCNGWWSNLCVTQRSLSALTIAWKITDGGSDVYGWSVSQDKITFLWNWLSPPTKFPSVSTGIILFPGVIVTWSSLLISVWAGSMGYDPTRNTETNVHLDCKW